MAVRSGRRTRLLIITGAAIAVALTAGGVVVFHGDGDANSTASGVPAAGRDGASDPGSDPASDTPGARPSATPPVGPSPSATPSRQASPSAKPAASHAPSPTAKAKAATPPAGLSSLPAGLSSLPGGTKQLIVVSTSAYSDTTATLRTYTKAASGAWSVAFPAMTARIGSHGFTDHKTEGDLATPTGLYSIGGTMYGISANPGVRYSYHPIVSGDYWNENPATAGYNSFVHGANPGGSSESLWTVKPQYNYFAVINYNTPAVPATPARGSGIFLHVMVAGRATAGCVSLASADLVKVLTWLAPTSAPRIVMAPAANLQQY